MTKLERAKAKAARDADKLAASQKQVAVEEAKESLPVSPMVNNKRRYHVGALADEAGLFALENRTLAHLFAVLTPLVRLPDPVGTLEALIGVPLVLATKGINVLPEDAEEAQVGGRVVANSQS